MHAEEARRLLEENEVAAVLGLVADAEGFVPHLFTGAPELGRMADGPKYPLGKTVWRTLRSMPPGSRLAVVCRTCDARAIREQEKMGQFPQRTVMCLIIPCDEEQARRCSCSLSTPEALASPPKPVLPDAAPYPAASRERAAFWREHMQRCIKCYGCRNICPVCICPECRLEDPSFVKPTVLPPSPLPWHLLRALHVAEHCVGCGACGDACPAGIPLPALHNGLSGYLLEEAGYVSGTDRRAPLTASAASSPTGTAVPEWKNCSGTCGSKICDFRNKGEAT
jgi:ferredoxin